MCRVWTAKNATDNGSKLNGADGGQAGGGSEGHHFFDLRMRSEVGGSTRQTQLEGE